MRRWIGLTLFVLAAMAIGRVITDTLPTNRFAADPFLRSGSVGETIDLGYGEVTVTGIRTADVLTSADNGIFPGTGTWLIVDTEVRATRGATPFLGIELHAPDGRLFFNSARASCPLNVDPPPGMRWHAMLCFEVPEDALQGLRFRMTRSPYNVDGDMQRRDAIADIDLGIDADRAEELWAAETAYTPHEAGPEPYDQQPFEEQP